MLKLDENNLQNYKFTVDEDKLNFLWITDFPFFEWSEAEKRWKAEHNPFTMVKDINTINDIGDSPIHTAVKNRNCEIVKMLIEKEVENWILSMY